MLVDIYHNILWSSYKAGVFSAIHRQAERSGIAATFYQIAETESSRIGLKTINKAAHDYPYTLLFQGSYDDIALTRLIWVLFANVFRSKADIILLPGYHRPEYWAMLLAALLSNKRRGVFCDSTLRDKPQRLLASILKRIFFRLCDGFFVYGIRASEHVRHYGAPDDLVVRRCQAAASEMRLERSQVLARRNFSKEDGKVKLLYVGRLAPEKNLEFLIKAVGRIIAENKISVRLDVVGSGPLAEDLLRLIESEQLSDNIFLHGSKESQALCDAYLDCDFLVLPSTSEPWGLVVNESLQLGCPVLVSDACGCVPDLVINGRTGYVFDPLSSESFKVAFEESLENLFRSIVASNNCIDVIYPYSAENAANHVLEGIQKLFGPSTV